MVASLRPPAVSTSSLASKKKRRERSDGGDDEATPATSRAASKRSRTTTATARPPLGASNPDERLVVAPPASAFAGQPRIAAQHRAALAEEGASSLRVLFWDVLDCSPSSSSSSSPAGSAATLVDFLRVAAQKLDEVWAACLRLGVEHVAVECQPPQATEDMKHMSYFLLGQAMAAAVPSIGSDRSRVRFQFAGRKRDLVERDGASSGSSGSSAAADDDEMSRASVARYRRDGRAATEEAEERRAREAAYAERKAAAIADTWFLLCPKTTVASGQGETVGRRGGGGAGVVEEPEGWMRWFAAQNKQDDAADAFLHATLAVVSPPHACGPSSGNARRRQKSGRRAAASRQRGSEGEEGLSGTTTTALGIDVGKRHLGVCIVQKTGRSSSNARPGGEGASE